MVERLENVRVVLAGDVACRLVVADGEDRRDVAADILQCTACLHGAANVRSTSPDDLREVTPLLPGVLLTGLRVGGVVHVDLRVVPHIGDHIGDLVDTSSDVLAVVTVADSPVRWLAARSRDIHELQGLHILVVSVLARVRNLLGPTGELIVPLNAGGAVVGPMEVVMVESHRLEVGRGWLGDRV